MSLFHTLVLKEIEKQRKTECKIDAMVYALYGLSEEKIAIVEGE